MRIYILPASSRTSCLDPVTHPINQPRPAAKAALGLSRTGTRTRRQKRQGQRGVCCPTAAFIDATGAGPHPPSNERRHGGCRAHTRHRFPTLTAGSGLTCAPMIGSGQVTDASTTLFWEQYSDCSNAATRGGPSRTGPTARKYVVVLSYRAYADDTAPSFATRARASGGPGSIHRARPTTGTKYEVGGQKRRF